MLLQKNLLQTIQRKGKKWMWKISKKNKESDKEFELDFGSDDEDKDE